MLGTNISSALSIHCFPWSRSLLLVTRRISWHRGHQVSRTGCPLTANLKDERCSTPWPMTPHLWRQHCVHLKHCPHLFVHLVIYFTGLSISKKDLTWLKNKNTWPTCTLWTVYSEMGMVVTHKDCVFGVLFGELKHFLSYLINMYTYLCIRRHVLSNSKIIGFICQHYHVEQIIRGKLINVNGKEKVGGKYSHFSFLLSPGHISLSQAQWHNRTLYAGKPSVKTVLFRYDRTKKYEIEKKSKIMDKYITENKEYKEQEK